MAVAGALEIQIFAEIARLRTDMEKATGIVERSSKQMASAANAARSALGALGLGLSVVGFAHLVKGSIDAMDHLNDLSKSTNLTVEQLAGLKVAAKQSGGDLDSIAASVLKLSVEMGKAPDKFRALGISATDPLEAFKQLSDIFNRIEDPQKRNAVAAVALGKAWAGSAPLLAEGSKRIGEMIAKGTEFSGVTTKMARDADAFNDKLALIVGSGGMVTRMVGPLLPLLNLMADDFLKVADQSKNLGNSFSPLLEILKTLVVLGSDTSFVFQTIGKEIAGLAAGAAMIATGDFAGARALGDTLRKDAEETRKALDVYQAAIMGIGTTAPAPGGSRRAFGHGGGGGPDTNAFLGVGDAERAKAAKAAADAIKKALKAEADSRLEVATLTKSLREQEIADGYKLEKLHETWAAEEAKLAADKLLASQEAVDAIRVSLLNEQELMAEHQNVQLEALRLARENKAITEAEYNEMALALEDQHTAAIGAIHDAAYRKRFGIANQYRKLDLDSAGFFFNQMAAMMTSRSREMFEIGKAAAIAGAVIDTYKAATGAYASLASIPIIGPALGAAAAAAAIVAGIANVQAISATTMGGGAATPTFAANPSTGLPVAAAGSAQGGGQATIIHLPGEDFVSTKTVRKLIERINENSKDGGRLVIA